jgi:hypothetical protein
MSKQAFLRVSFAERRLNEEQLGTSIHRPTSRSILVQEADAVLGRTLCSGLLRTEARRGEETFARRSSSSCLCRSLGWASGGGSFWSM